MTETTTIRRVMVASTATENLCDTCQHHFATCSARNAIFGCEVGAGLTADNVVYCDSYITTIKAED